TCLGIWSWTSAVALGGFLARHEVRALRLFMRLICRTTRDGRSQHYVRAGGLGLRLPDSDEGTYDVVFSSFALHYLVYFPKLVREFNRVLKPGGPSYSPSSTRFSLHRLALSS
ncbi:unnamed protein product, partial [Clonostachys rosea f. rosea IK726]